MTHKTGMANVFMFIANLQSKIGQSSDFLYKENYCPLDLFNIIIIYKGNDKIYYKVFKIYIPVKNRLL